MEMWLPNFCGSHPFLLRVPYQSIIQTLCFGTGQGWIPSARQLACDAQFSQLPLDLFAAINSPV